MKGRGFELAARSDRSDRGFGDSRVELDHDLAQQGRQGVDAASCRFERRWRSPTRALGDKSLIVFDSPRGHRRDGTPIARSRSSKPDDQWLYLPALQAGQAHLVGQQVGPVRRQRVRVRGLHGARAQQVRLPSTFDEEPCGELVCDRRRTSAIRATSTRATRSRSRGSTRRSTRSARSDFYDRKDGDLLKTLSLEHYREYEGAYSGGRTRARHGQPPDRQEHRSRLFGEYSLRRAGLERRRLRQGRPASASAEVRDVMLRTPSRDYSRSVTAAGQPCSVRAPAAAKASELQGLVRRRRSRLELRFFPKRPQWPSQFGRRASLP